MVCHVCKLAKHKAPDHIEKLRMQYTAQNLS